MMLPIVQKNRDTVQTLKVNLCKFMATQRTTRVTKNVKNSEYQSTVNADMHFVQSQIAVNYKHGAASKIVPPNDAQSRLH